MVHSRAALIPTQPPLKGGSMQLRALLIAIAAECDDLDLSPTAQRQIRARLIGLARRTVKSKPFRSALDLPPLHDLQKRYAYNSATGDVLLKLARQRFKVAGERHHSGYVRLNITIGGKRYRCAAHRAAWLLHYGAPPPLDLMIDHIDGDRANNAINNLRLASPKDNVAHSSERTGIVRLPPWARVAQRKTPAAEATGAM